MFCAEVLTGPDQGLSFEIGSEQDQKVYFYIGTDNFNRITRNLKKVKLVGKIRKVSGNLTETTMMEKD